ncbi:MAG TPA: hypothetical protein EYG03_15190 [Planctomycetes bacterium]|nr:hypothetical protein [Planctomycetaceae bacterium]HIK93305.1 hypothetical protein [Planctomycetota bacterium]
MTILRIGSNSKYAAGWDAAFPSKKSAKKKITTVKVKGGTKKKTARKKSTKKKTTTVKVKGGTKKVAKKKTARKKS